MVFISKILVLMQNGTSLATANIENINFTFSTVKEYNDHSAILVTRRKLAKTIRGTRQFHSFIPTDIVSDLLAKVYSYSTNTKIVKIMN